MAAAAGASGGGGLVVSETRAGWASAPSRVERPADLAGISEVEARRLALVSAQAAYDASQVGLEVGTRTVLDVLNNQQTLFNAQREYARAKYNFLQTRLTLEQSAGTLDGTDVQDVNRLLTVDTNVSAAAGG